jgi:hypothetical protein
LEKAYKKTWNTYVEADNPPETLYHYCRKDALCGILGSGKLWASDALRMKDQKEIVYSIDDVICKVVAETEDGHFKYIIPPVKSPEKVREALGGWCTHIACLSEKIDLPSQWQNYGDGGKGFACVFRRSRSRFRDDGDHHSGMMAITIGAKRRWLLL